MFRVTLKNVAGRKLRLALTALSVVLGVAFVAGTFVLTDSIRSTFDALLEQGSKNVSVSVRGEEARSVTQTGTGRVPIPLTLADKLRTVPGVESATPDINGVAILIGKDDTPARRGGGGPPSLGYAADPSDDTFELSAGRWPVASGEVAVEDGTLELAKLNVGDATRVVVGKDVQPVTIVGSVRFGAGISTAGSTIVLFDRDTAIREFAPDGTVQAISLRAAPGVSPDNLKDAVIAAGLPPRVEAVTGEKVAEEDRKELDEAIGFISIVLLVFAGVSLFVGGFIIANTFSMLVAQRTRELALLRVLGASRRQVNRTVLGEAFVIGLLGSTLGLLLGLGVAALLKFVLGQVGLEINSSLPLHPRTILAAFAVGLIVTVASAYFPARRASRIPPVAAMREDAVLSERGLRVRTFIGAVMAISGAAGVFVGLALDGKVGLITLGAGAAVLFLGVALVAPMLARPFVRVAGAPYRKLFGTVGHLARENAIRSPRRTATTAAALMIGLALVSGVTILASSAKAATGGLVDRNLSSDLVLSAGNAPMPTGVADRVAALPNVVSVARQSQAPIKVGDAEFGFASVVDGAFLDNFTLEAVSGDMDSVRAGSFLADKGTAESHGWEVGSSYQAETGSLKDEPLIFGGSYEPNGAAGSLVFPRALYDRSLPESQRVDWYVYVKAAPGSDLAAVRTSVNDAVKPFAIVSVQDKEEFKNDLAKQINQFLAVIYGLLALAIIIAIFGIINTLALSVFERTREIGLLRAVGLDRRQLKRTIRLEAVLIAVFGAVLGTLLGVFLAVVLQRALREQGLSELAIPYGQLAFGLVLAALVGVLAAVWPARRAAKLDVLRAVTSE